MKTFRIASCIGLLLVAGPAQAQSWFDDFRTFSLYVENDALAKWAKKTTDQSFTQGMRLTWDFAQWPDWARAMERWLSPVAWFRPTKSASGLPLSKSIEGACRPDHERSAGPCGSVTFGLAQTIYTPHDILSTDVQPRDQPYAGWLFATAGAMARSGRVHSTMEVVLGVVGPPSLAQDTQSLAHWTWSSGSARPSGWAHQLRSSIHGGVMQTHNFFAFERCLKGTNGCSGGPGEGRVFDIIAPRLEGVLTTTMVRGSLGATVRAGHRFPSAVGPRIPATGRLTQALPWVVVFGSIDAREVLFNGFLEGTYADQGTGQWGDIREITARRHVDERAIGFAFGRSTWSISVQGVSRSREWDPILSSGAIAPANTRHRYLSILATLSQGR